MFAYVQALPSLADPRTRVAVMQILASEAAQLAALRRSAGAVPVPDAFAGFTGAMTTVAAQVAERYAAARTDAGLFEAGLFVEQVAALAYRAAAAGPLAGDDRALALRFAGHEHEHAQVFETLLFALTVPVRRHATKADLDALLPGLRRAGPRRGARAARRAGGRRDRGPPADRPPRGRARRAALGRHGHGRRRPAPGGAARAQPARDRWSRLSKPAR